MVARIPKRQNYKAMTKKKQQAATRQTYTADQHEAARKMYLRGLYLTEISVLLNIPIRTLEKWQTAEKWTLLKGGEEIHKRAFEMKQSGKKADEIAKILNINRATVFKWIKAYKNEQDSRQPEN